MTDSLEVPMFTVFRMTSKEKRITLWNVWGIVIDKLKIFLSTSELFFGDFYSLILQSFNPKTKTNRERENIRDFHKCIFITHCVSENYGPQ